MILALISRETSPRSCINSNFVRSLDIGPSFKAYNCSLKKDYEGEVGLSTLKSLKQAQSSIDSIESFLSLNNLQVGMLRQPFLDLKVSSSLGASLLYELLGELNPNSSSIQKAIVSDILEKAIFGLTHMDHFITDSYVFVSEKTACERGFVPSSQNSYCELLKNKDVEANSFEALSHWSLRPMIYSAFLMKYYSSSLISKKELLQSIMKKFNLSKGLQFSGIEFSNFDIQYKKLSQIVLGYNLPIRALPYIFKLDHFHLAQSLDSYIQKWGLKHSGVYYYLGKYHTTFGQIVGKYSNKINVEREFWIVDKLPNLGSLEKSGRERVEIYKSGTYVRVHIPSIRMMYRLKLAKPVQNLDSVNTQSATAWLGFNPIEKM